MGTRRVLENEKGKLVDRTQEAGTANRLGWWTSVAHADFDNDGDSITWSETWG